MMVITLWDDSSSGIFGLLHRSKAGGIASASVSANLYGDDWMILSVLVRACS
jgi:hypothetical protein